MPNDKPVRAKIATHVHSTAARKRALFPKYGDRLATMLDAESMFQGGLRENGHQLYLEPVVKTHHEMSRCPFCGLLTLVGVW